MFVNSRLTGWLLACVCVLGLAGAARAASLTTTLVASGLDEPIFVASPPGDHNRLFIVERTGRIKIMNRATGEINATPFLDISSRILLGVEQGLYIIAFHPNYAQNGYFYLDYIDIHGDSQIARYTVSSNPDVADPATFLSILWVNQPRSNHNGGWLGFGPDGYLYVSFGDGGSQCDPNGNGQRITGELLADMLRIDVNGPDAYPSDAQRTYAIPPTNPLVGRTGEDEIWCYGMRNPWRCSFDRLTGDFYIGDVGQKRREEIDVQPASSTGGEDYGWNCMEGTECSNISPSGCTPFGCTCGDPGLVPPIHQYDHGNGRCSITGGYVYRGHHIPGLAGTYFFADYCSSQIWSLRYTVPNLPGVPGGVQDLTERTAELRPAGQPAISSIVSFGEDVDGEVYIVEMQLEANVGKIYKIVPANDAPGDINADGLIDVADADLLVRSLLEQRPADPALYSRSDVNNDGADDGSDIPAWLATLATPP